MLDPNLGQPYSYQATAGVKHDFGNGFAVGANYLYNHGLHQIRRRDLNAPVNGTTVRPDPTMGRELIHEGTGLRTYNGLILNAERRFGQRWRFSAAYTLSSSWSDSEARNSTTLPTDQYNLHADWSPSDNNARHNLVVTGQVTLPFDIQMSAITSTVRPTRSTSRRVATRTTTADLATGPTRIQTAGIRPTAT
jgi:hypothetical protein